MSDDLRMSTGNDDPLRALGKQLPYDRPDASRRDNVRSSLLIAASEGRQPAVARRWILVGGGFVAGALAAAAVAIVLLRGDTTTSPSAREGFATIESSSAAELERSTVTTSTGTDELVRVRSGKLRLAVPSVRTGDHVRLQTGDAEVEGSGAYEVVVTADALASVTVATGTATIRVKGQQQAVFLAAGETWRAPVITADLDIAPATPDVVPTTADVDPSTPTAQSTAPLEPAIAAAALPTSIAPMPKSPAPTEPAVASAAPLTKITAPTRPTAAAPATNSTADARPAAALTKSTAPSEPSVTAAGLPTNRSADARPTVGAPTKVTAPTRPLAAAPPTNRSADARPTVGAPTKVTEPTRPLAAAPPPNRSVGAPTKVTAPTRPTAAAPPTKITAPTRPVATAPPTKNTSPIDPAVTAAAPTTGVGPTTVASRPSITAVADPAPALATGNSPTEKHFRAGYALLRANKHADAATELGKAADGDGPLAADARYFQAVALSKAGRGRDAERALVAFLDRAPTSVRRGRASVMLARLLVERGDTKSARAWFESALADTDPAVATAARAGIDALK